MRLVFRAAPVAAALALILPAAASADTTVDPAFTGTCEREATCATIADAVAAVAAGDTIKVLPGTYAESVTIPAGKDGLTLDGATGVALVGGITVGSDDVAVSRFAISRPMGDDAAVIANGDGFSLDDAFVVGVTSPALTVTGGAHVRRSLLVGAAAAADAIRADTAAGEHAIAVDSSVLVGGAEAAGIAVTPTGPTAGPVTVDLRHVTIPGTNRYGIELDSSGAPALPLSEPPGNITATISGSIVHGQEGSLARNYDGLAANAIEATFANSDAQAMRTASVTALGQEVSGSPRGPTVDMGMATVTADAALFGPTFRLLVGSPAIDTGGAVVGGESQTDIDGDPRLVGAATDIGADEFVNTAPVAKGLTATPASPVSGQAVTFTFDAADPDPGDKLFYGIDWGDGSPRQSADANVVGHVYERPGTYTVQFAAIDASTTPSNLVSQTITVRDGAKPTARITNRKLLAKRRELRVRGRAADESGVAKVEVALTRNAGCRQFTGKRFRRSGGCRKNLIWLAATQFGGDRFELTTDPDVKIRRGKYTIRARATDTAGNVGTKFSREARSQVRLRVR